MTDTNSISVSQDAKSASTKTLVRNLDAGIALAVVGAVLGAALIVRYGVVWLLTGVLQ